LNLLRLPRGRRALFAALYFTEGAPIGFLWWALPTVMRESGGDTQQIGALLSLLVLPWALKFLWAPFVDVLRGPRWTLRGWIATAQLVMTASLLPLLVLDATSATGWLVAALVLHAFAAATQDVAIDALAIAATPASERGSINGWMQAGMLLGRAGFGGGGLLIRARFGDRALVLALILVLLAGVALAFLYRDSASRQRVRSAAQTPLRSFAHHLRAALASRATWLALAFAATSGAAFEAVGGLAGPMLVDAGASAETIGHFFLLPAVAAMLAGALVGGRAADRFGRRRAVFGTGLAVVVAVLALASLPAQPSSIAAHLGILCAVYLAIGLFTAASYALFMDLCDPRLGATQFSAYMGATNLCEAWAVGAGGAVAGLRGYPAAFAILAAASLLSLGLLPWLRRDASGPLGGE